MSVGLAFWVCMLIWVVFSGWSQRAGGPGVWGGSLLLSILLVLLGWAQFGAPIHG